MPSLKRRTISVMDLTHARISALVDKRNADLDAGVPGAPKPTVVNRRGSTPDRWNRSNMVEELIAEACDRAGVPKVDVAPARKPRAKPDDDHPSAHFTF